VTIDDGIAVAYTALSTGIPVYGSDEVEVGKLREVLDNAREHIFDGIVVERHDGVPVFVDAPEVARTAEKAVTLNITAAEVDEYPPHKGGGLGGKLFRR
jgi:ApbE superfamily uncharacterized protein (UPF0280 family)